eukprot:CAMPEP_0170505124 /NCGR_PEP_ID=MMETSP0208-20121228/49927_1 /TAXON_ID=197538 /ORGANISM="Strombidium inclinatum, Strain S3" /LENGTH=51 /DNA_ID=CAMNT_0010785777 /DNA_START=450 /DNA_END=602 /DNA_ORIENTATION=+
MTCLVVTVFIILIASLVGGCLFMAGSATALKMIEDLLKNIEKLPEMMMRGG